MKRKAHIGVLICLALTEQSLSLPALAQVQEQYSQTFTVTGEQGGSFVITATVRSTGGGQQTELKPAAQPGLGGVGYSNASGGLGTSNGVPTSPGLGSDEYNGGNGYANTMGRARLDQPASPAQTSNGDQMEPSNAGNAGGPGNAGGGYADTTGVGTRSNTAGAGDAMDRGNVWSDTTGGGRWPAAPLANPAQTAAVQRQVNDMSGRLGEQIRAQQQQLLNSLNQLQQRQRATQAGINAQAQQIANLRNAQQAQTNVAQAQLQAQQAFINRLFLQYQRDAMLRNFERALRANGLFNNGLANLGPLGANNLFSLINQLASALQQERQQKQNAKDSADEIADRLSELLSSKLPDQTAKKVLDALKSSVDANGGPATNDVTKQFASLNDQLATAKAPYSVDPDDYERLAQLAEQLGQNDKRVEKNFLELSMEATARVAANREVSDDQRRRARNFAVHLTTKMGQLKTRFGDELSDSDLRSALDFDIDKCMRIANGKDIFA